MLKPIIITLFIIGVVSMSFVGIPLTEEVCHLHYYTTHIYLINAFDTGKKDDLFLLFFYSCSWGTFCLGIFYFMKNTTGR